MTPQQGIFAQGIAKGLNQTEAYRTAYPKACPTSARREGSRPGTNPNILAEINRLRGEVSASFTMSRVEWLESFRRNARKAEEAGDYSAARAHLREIGLATRGWYASEKLDVETKGKITVTIGTMTEVVARVRAAR